MKKEVLGYCNFLWPSHWSDNNRVCVQWWWWRSTILDFLHLAHANLFIYLLSFYCAHLTDTVTLLELFSLFPFNKLYSSHCLMLTTFIYPTHAYTSKNIKFNQCISINNHIKYFVWLPLILFLEYHQAQQKSWSLVISFWKLDPQGVGGTHNFGNHRT